MSEHTFTNYFTEVKNKMDKKNNQSKEQIVVLENRVISIELSKEDIERVLSELLKLNIKLKIVPVNTPISGDRTYDEWKNEVGNVCDECNEVIPETEPINFFLSEHKQYCDKCRNKVKGF